MSDSASFQIMYGGPALESNEMDVRELAPALIAVADLLEEANLIINGGGSKISVNVHGSFKRGSFGIDFRVIQDIYQSFLTLFNSDGVSGAANLLSLLGLVEYGKGLIGFLKKLNNRNIQKAEHLEDDRVEITITREEKIVIPKNVLDLYKSPKIRKALENIITEPLTRRGIDEFRSGYSDHEEQVVISKEEKELFGMPLLGDEVLGENTTEAYLQVVSLSFKEDNKWRFSRGEVVFYANIEDNEFLERINRNEIHFSKDDILKVRLYTRDILTGSGFKTEYKVLEILEHRSASRQLKLPMDE